MSRLKESTYELSPRAAARQKLQTAKQLVENRKSVAKNPTHKTTQVGGLLNAVRP